MLATLLLLLPPSALPLALLQEPEGETAEGGGGPDFYLLLIALVAVFYFVMILPEKKNRKKRADMLGGLKKGDKVITTSGLYGSVATIQGDVVTLQVADGVRMRFSRAAIQSVLSEDPEEAASNKGEPAGS